MSIDSCLDRKSMKFSCFHVLGSLGILGGHFDMSLACATDLALYFGSDDRIPKVEFVCSDWHWVSEPQTQILGTPVGELVRD